MTPKERILMIRLMRKLENQPEYAKKIGLDMAYTQVDVSCPKTNGNNVRI